MAQFEYRVVPAPVRGIKVKGARTPEDRFAEALAEVMNELGRDGWEYVRCDTLPSEERTGLTGRTTVYRNMLVFRRTVSAADRAAAPVPTAPAVTSLAARMAATLRPAAASAPAATRPTPPLPDPADIPPEADDRPATAPALGPADRGSVGSAPRLVVDRGDPDPTRLRPDGSTTG
jgi:hypothetical protein